MDFINGRSGSRIPPQRHSLGAVDNQRTRFGRGDTWRGRRGENRRGDEQQVDEQDDVDHLFARRDGGQIGQDQEGRQRPHDRQTDDDETYPERARAGARERRTIGLEQGIERRLRLCHPLAHALGSLPRRAGDVPARLLQRGEPAAANCPHCFDRSMSAHWIAVLCSKATTLITGHCGIFATMSA